VGSGDETSESIGQSRFPCRRFPTDQQQRYEPTRKRDSLLFPTTTTTAAGNNAINIFCNRYRNSRRKFMGEIRPMQSPKYCCRKPHDQYACNFLRMYDAEQIAHGIHPLLAYTSPHSSTYYYSNTLIQFLKYFQNLGNFRHEREESHSHLGTEDFLPSWNSWCPIFFQQQTRDWSLEFIGLDLKSLIIITRHARGEELQRKTKSFIALYASILDISRIAYCLLCVC